MEQLNLFQDIKELNEINKPEQEDIKPKIDYGDWCLVYLVAECGGFIGNSFILHREDAMKFCLDDCSKGVGSFGGHWHFQWTSLEHFVHQNDTYDGRLEDFVFIHDSGKQDKDFERLGIIKPRLSEMMEVLKSFGYQMKWK